MASPSLFRPFSNTSHRRPAPPVVGAAGLPSDPSPLCAGPPRLSLPGTAGFTPPGRRPPASRGPDPAFPWPDLRAPGGLGDGEQLPPCPGWLGPVRPLLVAAAHDGGVPHASCGRARVVLELVTAATAMGADLSPFSPRGPNNMCLVVMLGAVPRRQQVPFLFSSLSTLICKVLRCHRSGGAEVVSTPSWHYGGVASPA